MGEYIEKLDYHNAARNIAFIGFPFGRRENFDSEIHFIE